MKVLSFGEILWDVIEGTAYIGGAPFNAAAHLAKMGVDSAIVSSVGRDRLGDAAFNAAKSFGLDTSYIARHESAPTGTVEVTVDAGGQPSYVIREHTAWDSIALDAGLLDRIGADSWDFLCFGTLAQRTEQNRELLAELTGRAHSKNVLYDVNLRQDFFRREWIESSLRACTVLKLNGDEADVIGEMFLGKSLAVQPFSEAISKDFDIPVVCVTLGEEGAAIYDRGQNAWVPGTPVSVTDAVGAGDAFAAGFMFSLLYGKTPVEATGFACRIGAWVASQRGAVPEYSEELHRQLERIRTGPAIRS